MKTYTWLVKREFWENRAIWMIPVGLGIALTLAALFGRADVTGLPVTQSDRAVGVTVLFAFGILFFVVMSVYSSWYLLDCLYAERKDRSILFWKSLPVSDTATVLAKLFTALIAIPLVYFVAADICTLLVAFIVSIRAPAILGGALWQSDLWLQLQVLWLYLIITTAIWYLPFAGWLLVVSAWAKRAVMLWSILPLVALYLLERRFFGTHFVSTALEERAFGYYSHAFGGLPGHMAWLTQPAGWAPSDRPSSVWQLVSPLDFLSSAQTWTGVAVGAGLVAVAIQLRWRRPE